MVRSFPARGSLVSRATQRTAAAAAIRSGQVTPRMQKELGKLFGTNAERMRRSLGVDGDHEALDALLAEQDEDGRDLMSMQARIADLLAERQQAIDALRQIAGIDLVKYVGAPLLEVQRIARGALMNLGEKP